MATEEDNFDIDIYGDGGEDYQEDEPVKMEAEEETTQANASQDPSKHEQEVYDGIKSEARSNGHSDKPANPVDNSNDVAQKIASTDESSLDPLHLPKQAPQIQGLKRKDGADDRFVDQGATTALFVSELHWWITDDDIRGWANQAQCEDELEDMTFSEHKVNGKSKG